MNAMLDSMPLSISECPDLEEMVLVERQPASPSLIVLQPGGVLDQTSSVAFQTVLETSLAQATDTVIVDLLWVETIDAWGVLVLVASLHQAATLGKTLSFQSMDSQTRLALEAELHRQREISFGPWSDLFEQDLEQFLNGGKKG